MISFFGKRSNININGKNYSGNNITVNNGVVIIDGVEQGEIDEKKIEITVLCNVDRIESEQSISVKGDVTGSISAGSSVNCNKVKGNVSAGSSVNCDNITGNVTAGSSVTCDDIGGNVSANRVIRG